MLFLSIQATIAYDAYYMCFSDHKDSERMISFSPLSEIFKIVFDSFYPYTFNYI